MKVLAVNGSARKDGNTADMLRIVMAELEKKKIKTELVQLAGKHIQGCIACYRCVKNKDGRCAVKKDMLNDLLGMMEDADGILLGSPTYFADVSSNMKSLIDRAGFVVRANDHMLRRKVGAAVVAVRRGGSIHVFDTMNHFFLISQMVVPGSIYWKMGIGRDKGEAVKDEESVMTMQVLGENMAWLMKKLRSR